jgi:DNA-binding protein HU-beta
VVKHRAQKTGRILARNTTIIIPAHDVPAFKPADTFVDKVKNRSQGGKP